MAVASGVGLSVGGAAVAVGAGVSVAVGAGVDVAVGAGVSVGAGAEVGVGAGVSVGIGDGVLVGKGEAVGAGAAVNVGSGVWLGGMVYAGGVIELFASAPGLAGAAVTATVMPTPAAMGADGPCEGVGLTCPFIPVEPNTFIPKLGFES